MVDMGSASTLSQRAMTWRRRSKAYPHHHVICVLVGCVVVAKAAQYNTSAFTNWIQLEVDASFPGRNGHAAAMFKDRLWVVGGTGEPYQTHRLNFQKRRGDVWSSSDGITWRQSEDLTGDFYLQNYDAVNPGSLAPWYARFGHTLDVLNVTKSDGDTTEAMVLTGGYTPDPDNDVWITTDGSDWRFAGNAEWRARAWHESSVFMNRLFIIGGSPLANDVWAGNVGQDSSGRWYSTWELKASGDSVPFSPRAGLASAVMRRPPVETTSGKVLHNDTLFVLGGFGGWPEADSRFDGMRCRNDVYKTQDGVSWSVVTEDAAWGPRGWFDVVSLSGLSDPYADVAAHSDSRHLGGGSPRLWLAGGGYMGQKGNSIVDKMVGYVDTWFSVDGSNWYQVHYQEGSGSNLYSSMEWALTEVDNDPVYLGKWGHRMLPWRKRNDAGEEEPAIYFLAGDAVGSGSFVSDVFVSTETLFCSLEGVVCGGVGSCVDFGCTCPTHAGGDFCRDRDSDFRSTAARILRLDNWPGAVTLVATVAVTTLTLGSSDLRSVHDGLTRAWLVI